MNYYWYMPLYWPAIVSFHFANPSSSSVNTGDKGRCPLSLIPIPSIPGRRGMLPANELARRHPAVLNLRTEPLQWAKGAARQGLPESMWAPVVADLRAAAGTNPSPNPEQGPGSPAAAPAAEASGDAASASLSLEPDPGSRSFSSVSASGAASRLTVPSSSSGGGDGGCGGAGSPAAADGQQSAAAGAAPEAPLRPDSGGAEASVEGPIVRRRRLHFPRAADRGKLFDGHGRAQ